VTGHEIVPADDLAVLRSHHKELLTLQACHPRFFATHRYLAFAKLVSVDPRHGKPYTLAAASPHDSLARAGPGGPRDSAYRPAIAGAPVSPVSPLPQLRG
jgi:hypothetical protein